MSDREKDLRGDNGQMAQFKAKMSDGGKKPKPPSIATMTRWMNDGVAKAVDGCRVEPDGTCQHGSPSWLLKLGYI